MKIAMKLAAIALTLTGLLAPASVPARRPSQLRCRCCTTTTSRPEAGPWAQVRPKGPWWIFIDGMAFIYKMHWSRWNGKTAVATAVYYDRTGPCCTKADRRYYKITMTLSDVWRSRSVPDPTSTR